MSLLTFKEWIPFPIPQNGTYVEGEARNLQKNRSDLTPVLLLENKIK